MKIIIVLLSFILIFDNKNVVVKSKSEWCSPEYCYHEGICKKIRGKITCECIGDKYFTGKYCNITYNHCSDPSICNGGRCVNVVGQPMCTNCLAGYFGQYCNLSNVIGPSDILLLFNHYGYVGKEHLFLTTVSHIGRLTFSTKFQSQNDFIDLYTTKPENKKEWHQHHKLTFLAHQKNILLLEKLPYEIGYYHISKQTFLFEGMQHITLIFTTDHGIYYYKEFELLILKKASTIICQPMAIIVSRSNAKYIAESNISRFTIIEALVTKRCYNNSVLLFYWSIYNMIGSKLIKKYQPTERPILKIEPFFLSYVGNKLVSTRVLLTFVEYTDDFFAKWSDMVNEFSYQTFILLYSHNITYIYINISTLYL